jgi:hypothetical protein
MNALKPFALSMLSLVVLALAPLGSAWAQVKVTAATPSSTYQGTVSLDVTVDGSGFDSTAQAAFFVSGTTDPGGVTVRKTVFKSSKQVVATIDVADTAVVANFDIQIKLDSGRKGKGTTLFAVQKKVVAVDPCSSASPDYITNWAGFPAFAYIVFDYKSYTHEVRVASRNGVCSKRLGDTQPARGGSTSFVRLTDGSYLIAYYNGSLMLVQFNIGGTAETPTTIPATFATFRTNVTGDLDLAPDGTHLAYERSAAYPTKQVVVADINDSSGTGDVVVQAFDDHDVSALSWAPWGRLYYDETNLVTGKRLQSVSPWLDASQTPETILQFAANEPLTINRLFSIGRISSGYAGYDTSGAVPNIVFQGDYTTSVTKHAGRITGTGCAAAYAIHADTKQFLIGSMDVPSPIIGFYPSVTGNGTVLYDKSTAPSSNSTCTATGYLGEAALAIGYTPSLAGQPAGSWPAALKNP